MDQETTVPIEVYKKTLEKAELLQQRSELQSKVHKQELKKAKKIKEIQIMKLEAELLSLKIEFIKREADFEKKETDFEKKKTDFKKKEIDLINKEIDLEKKETELIHKEHNELLRTKLRQNAKLQLKINTSGIAEKENATNKIDYFWKPLSLCTSTVLLILIIMKITHFI